jgi:hypothetical protein
MNERFADYVAALLPLTERLRNSQPLTLDEIAGLRSPDVYCFSEGAMILYVGRTRNFRDRHKDHCDVNSGENKAAFAFRLARAASGKPRPSYKKTGSRKDLMADPDFLKAFVAAKERIGHMEVRFVEVSDPIQQHLLELYASLEFGSEHNSFETT